MGRKPAIPEGQTLPAEVGHWSHDPDAHWNGHTWVGGDSPLEVVVFKHLNSARVEVIDTRISGFDSQFTVAERELDIGHESTAKLTWWAVEKAVAWMEQHDPETWGHPYVDEAVFDAPPGFEVAEYYVENRESIIYYEQPGDALEMAGRGIDTEPSLNTRKYLYIRTWRGSGNSTIALAPWEGAHDHQMHEVVDPPEECGLDVAIKLAREWVAEQRGEPLASDTSGQTDIEQFI